MSLCGGRLVGSMALPGSNPTQFPAGLRVLVVDDDPTCLKILEKMLQACQYEVTKCDRAEYALNELRRNKNGFDIVLSDVHMPDMDGFKLLEYIGLEMDLPVIMMSADDGKNVVMKGVTHGACDYLIKPVRIEALKNIWQHVVRKKKNEWKDIEQSGSVDEGDNKAQRQDEAEYSSPANEGSWKSSKRKGEDDDAEDKDDSSSLKKPRVVWSVELHAGYRVRYLRRPKRGRCRQSAMVLKTELCRFSGAKIYPGRGIRFIRSDSQVFLFANSKCKRYFHNRLKPAKLCWTAVYRKQHKKDIAAEAVKKRRRAAKKPYSRSIVGVTLEVIQKKRSEKPEVRDAAREAALREIKERNKKTKDEKRAKKAESGAKSKTQTKSQPKGAGGKGPKLGGGGGKR